MNQRISVDLAGARVEETAARVTRQAKEVQNAEDRALERLDGIGLVVDGSGGTSEVVDLVDFHKDGLTDVMENEVEVLLS